MDFLPHLWRLLAPVLLALMGLVVALVLVRLARERYLRRVTLDDRRIRELQVSLTEEARRASLRQGMEIDLAPFWKGSRLREPDRRAVIHPLMDEHVFGWIERPSADGFERFLEAVGRLVWNPTRRKVFVSQWVTNERKPTQLVIEQALGPLIFGDVDNSITHGNRAGRDTIGGDRVGRDKVGGDATTTSAGGSVFGSGNHGPTSVGHVEITSESELRDALKALSQRAADRAEPEDVVAALRWAADMANSDAAPAAREQTRHQRVLDRASSWVRNGLDVIVKGVTGALAEHWLVELIKG